MAQKAITALFDIGVPAINKHLTKLSKQSKKLMQSMIFLINPKR